MYYAVNEFAFRLKHGEAIRMCSWLSLLGNERRSALKSVQVEVVMCCRHRESYHSQYSDLLQSWGITNFDIFDHFPEPEDCTGMRMGVDFNCKYGPVSRTTSA